MKLNTTHRYLTWNCFALAVAHTVPLSVAPLKHGLLQQLNMDVYTGGLTSEMVRQSPVPSYGGSTTLLLTAVV